MQKEIWGYAPDYVKAMWLMLQHEKPDDYIIATGKTHTVRYFIELVAKQHGYDIIWEGEGVNERGIDSRSGKTLIKISPKYFRPSEVDYLCGDPTFAKEKLNWEPKVNLNELVKIMVESDNLLAKQQSIVWNQKK